MDFIQSALTPDKLAYNEYRDYITYKELAKVEPVPAFRRILQRLQKHEHGDFLFWRRLATKHEFSINPFIIPLLKFMRRFLGLTFIVKYLERKEREAIQNYMAFLRYADAPMRKRIRKIVKHELAHEKQLVRHIKEQKIEFMSSIILGMNDGLIELTGALVGFSFAFRNHITIALTGLITGIAASLSMAASAYMQARHEIGGKDAKKSAIYTGISYIVVVLLLVLPFLLAVDTLVALMIMFAVVLVIIFSISYYTAILFERDFKKQFLQMLLFSVGVALVSFLIGSVVRYVGGSEFRT